MWCSPLCARMHLSQCHPARLSHQRSLISTIALAHHFVGVSWGTGSMVPRRTLRSRSPLTAAFQWWGTGIGFRLYFGVEVAGQYLASQSFEVAVGAYTHWMLRMQSDQGATPATSLYSLVSVGMESGWGLVVVAPALGTLRAPKAAVLVGMNCYHWYP